MKWLFRLLTAAYIVTLGITVMGFLGYLGPVPEALGDGLLGLLGLPWNKLIDEDHVYAMTVRLLSPAVNMGILWLIADLLDSREE